MPITRVAHVELGVENVDAVVRFHEEVLGLSQIATHDGATYLGCGADENVDLVLSPGSGLRCVALEVAFDSDLDAYAERLDGAGIDVQPRDGIEPRRRRSIRFAAPSGHILELVSSEDRRPYEHPAMTAFPRHRGIAPLDLDHLTLRTPDAKSLTEFLCETLDFSVSDSFQPAPDVWQASWLRVGERHHDVAIIGVPETDDLLDHVAWTVGSIDEIKRGADELSRAGVPLETFPGRHGIGGSVSAYFWAPGGHRYELCAEMARVLASAEPGVWDDYAAGFSAWGVAPPDSFSRGS